MKSWVQATDGTFFQGEISKTSKKPDGFGILIFPGYKMIIGNCVNSKANGKTIIFKQDGERQVCTYIEDKLNGRVEMTYLATKKTRTANWKDGK